MTPTPYLMTSVLGELENATVANLGLSGYGPQQELATLKRYALPLNPKTIVWVFYEGNDLGNVDGYERDIAALTNENRFMPWMRSFSRNALLALGRIRRGCIPERSLMQSVTPSYGILTEATGESILPIDGTALSEKDLNALSRTGSMLRRGLSSLSGAWHSVRGRVRAGETSRLSWSPQCGRSVRRGQAVDRQRPSGTAPRNRGGYLTRYFLCRFDRDLQNRDRERRGRVPAG